MICGSLYGLADGVLLEIEYMTKSFIGRGTAAAVKSSGKPKPFVGQGTAATIKVKKPRSAPK